MKHRLLAQTTPIHKRLPLLMLLACAATVLLASALYLAHDVFNFRRRMDEQLDSIARIVALNSTAALMFQDRETGAEVLASLRNEEAIQCAGIYDRDGGLFASFVSSDACKTVLPANGDRSPSRTSSGVRIVEHTIEMEGETLGHVRLCASTASLGAHAYSYLHFVCMVVLGVSVIAFYLSRTILGRIVTPLAALTDAAKSVTRDSDYSVRVSPDNAGDMAELVAAFNAMLDEIGGSSEALVAHQERLRALTQSLQTAEECERTTLAAALHDSVCQTLFGIQLMLSSLSAKLDDGPDARERLQQLRERVNAAISEARSITTRLTPRGIHELGLATSLEDAAADLLNGCPIDVQLQDQSAGLELPSEARILTFRCVQELLRNIRKHANARNVTIELKHGDGVLCITVADDGDGFDPETALDGHRTDSGFGLFSIMERISFAGGSVHVNSAPGAGATITLNVPLEARESSP